MTRIDFRLVLIGLAVSVLDIRFCDSKFLIFNVTEHIKLVRPIFSLAYHTNFRVQIGSGLIRFGSFRVRVYIGSIRVRVSSDLIRIISNLGSIRVITVSCRFGFGLV